MTNETIARNYAATLFELARRHEGLEVFSEGMQAVVRLLEENPSFKLFLETPRISDREKKEVLRKVFGPVLPRTLVNFLLVTVDKRRQRLLGAIADEFESLLDEHLGRMHVEVTLAREPDAEGQRALAAKLSDLVGKEVIPHLRIKPAVLGGIHIKAGDMVFDGTLRRRIKQLRRQLLTAKLPAAAHGGESG